MVKQPMGDNWNLPDRDPDSQHYGRSFIFNFSYLENGDIKNTIKTYIWGNYIVGNKTVYRLYGENGSLKTIAEFLEQYGIYSLKNITPNDCDNLMSYLRTVPSEKKGKPRSYLTQKTIFSAFKSLVYWSQIHNPGAVPKGEIFLGNEFRQVESKPTIEFIPEDILIQINNALKTEDNPYLKYGIIILETTGIRLGDLLNLEVDCIKKHPINGHTISWYDHKNRKGYGPMVVKEECVRAINNLIKETQELREQAPNEIKNRLFLHSFSRGRHARSIRSMTEGTYHRWLGEFAERHNICNSDGTAYHLTAHQFRRTLATDMLSKGSNINVIKEVLGHSSPITTAQHYADIKDKERAETFKKVGIIGNIHDIGTDLIPSPTELKWFRENMNTKAAMCDGYCTQPFKDGQVCERLLRRQKCYSCARYITTPEYLEAHRTHLRNLERQLENNIYGEHYAEHFTPTIAVLKEIITRLEDISNGQQ